MAAMALKGGRLGQTFNDIPASIGYVSLACFLYSIVSKYTIPRKLFLFIGFVSYELYLTHMLVFQVAVKIIMPSLNIPVNIVISWFVLLPGALLFAYIFSWFMNVLLCIGRK
jgi:peptidoglycan/LPS O-acetylase OafA/YrhL